MDGVGECFLEDLVDGELDCFGWFVWWYWVDGYVWFDFCLLYLGEQCFEVGECGLWIVVLMMVQLGQQYLYIVECFVCGLCDCVECFGGYFWFDGCGVVCVVCLCDYDGQ